MSFRADASADREEADGRIKRRKVSFFSELTRSSNRGENLLEKLRRVGDPYDHPYHPETNEDFQQWADLIDRHLSQFPARIRHEISEEKLEISSNDLRLYYFAVCNIVAEFILGAEDGNYSGEDIETTEWRGPNIDVDTEDEVELAIRLCPELFRLFVERNVTDFANLTQSEKSVSFIPFLLDMPPRFGSGIDNEENIRFLAGLLLNNDSKWQPATRECDEKSLEVLVQLRERGFIEKRQVTEILANFLNEAPNSWSKRSFEFMEKRLRLLIEWEPTICYDFRIFWYSLPWNVDGLVMSKDIRYYELMLELGNLHYPNKLLGLGFHKPNFETACYVFGRETAKRTMNDQIQKAIAQDGNNNKKKFLLALILKAATQKKCLDGLYTLIRFDPVLLRTVEAKSFIRAFRN